MKKEIVVFSEINNVDYLGWKESLCFLLRSAFGIYLALVTWIRSGFRLWSGLRSRAMAACSKLQKTEENSHHAKARFAPLDYERESKQLAGLQQNAQWYAKRRFMGWIFILVWGKAWTLSFSSETDDKIVDGIDYPPPMIPPIELEVFKNKIPVLFS